MIHGVFPRLFDLKHVLCASSGGMRDLSASVGPLLVRFVACGSVLALIVGLHQLQESRELAKHNGLIAASNGRLLRTRDWPHAQPPALTSYAPAQARAGLPAGTHHRIRIKGGFTATIESDRNGQSSPLRMAYAFESVVHREIESNDGVRIVEVRTFERLYRVRLTAVGSLVWDWGAADQPLLDPVACERWFRSRKPRASEALVSTILPGHLHGIGADTSLDGELMTSSLTGKRVRLVYREGKLESLTPLGCELTIEEVQYLVSSPLFPEISPACQASGNNASKRDRLRLESWRALLGPALKGYPVHEGWVQSVSGDLQTEQDRVVSAHLRWPLGPRIPYQLNALLQTPELIDPGPFELTYDQSLAEAVAPRYAERESAPFVDLAAGLAWLVLASVGLTVMGFCIARSLPRFVYNSLAVLTVAVLFAFGVGWHGSLRLAEWLPVTNVILLGNLLPPLACFFSGLILGQRAMPWANRVGTGLLISCLGWYTPVSDLMLQPFPASICWVREGVWLQTLPESCSASAAVTLLDHYGIESSEAEMMRLSLTRRRGTPLLGLYRGLKLKTQQTSWDVRVVRGALEELLAGQEAPILLRVRPQDGSAAGWLPRGEAEHAVVLLANTPDGLVEIGDPADHVRPRNQWTREKLERRWLGEGFQIVPRFPTDGTQLGEAASHPPRL